MKKCLSTGNGEISQIFKKDSCGRAAICIFCKNYNIIIGKIEFHVVKAAEMGRERPEEKAKPGLHKTSHWQPERRSCTLNVYIMDGAKKKNKKTQPFKEANRK